MDLFQFYTLSLTLLPLFCAWYLIKRLKSGGGDASPPSPPTLLVIIGNLHQTQPVDTQIPLQIINQIRPFNAPPPRAETRAGCFVGRYGEGDNPNPRSCICRQARDDDVKKIFYDGNDVLHLPYGELWRKLRRIVVNELLSSTRVKSFNSIREEEIALFVKKIEECSFSSRPVNLSKMLVALSNDLISLAAFGRKHSEEEHGKKCNLTYALEYLEQEM